jgi:hypothetical protein
MHFPLVMHHGRTGQPVAARGIFSLNLGGTRSPSTHQVVPVLLPGPRLLIVLLLLLIYFSQELTMLLMHGRPVQLLAFFRAINSSPIGERIQVIRKHWDGHNLKEITYLQPPHLRRFLVCCGGPKHRKHKCPRIAMTGRLGISEFPDARTRSRCLHFSGIMLASIEVGCPQ